MGYRERKVDPAGLAYEKRLYRAGKSIRLMKQENHIGTHNYEAGCGPGLGNFESPDINSAPTMTQRVLTRRT